MCLFLPLLIACGLLAWRFELESQLATWSIVVVPSVLAYVGIVVSDSRHRARLRAERGPRTWEAFETEFAGCTYPPEAVRAAYEFLSRYADFALRRSDDLRSVLCVDDEDLEDDFEERCARFGCSDHTRYTGVMTEFTVEGYVRLLARLLGDRPPPAGSNVCSSSTSST
ncbi:MAG: hypothetical protein L6Q99_08720 [Planctomycetes bacterium]|nr:hypothetical protein [Planctomycetota bacterium]